MTTGGAERMEREAGAPAARPEDYSHLPRAGRRLAADFRKRVVGRVSASSPASVLEVGCGQGWLLAEIAPALPSARLAGIDVREDAVAYARGLVPHAELLVGDGARLPFADASFDVVVCSEVLEHVGDPDEVLREIVRVGRGRAVLSVPHEPWFRLANLLRGKYPATLGDCPGHVQHWSGRGFRALLSRRYSSVSVETSFPWLVATAEEGR